MIGVGWWGCPAFLSPEHKDQLGSLALRQTADRLRRRDSAYLQHFAHLNAPIFGHGKQHVEDLRRLDVVRWIVEQGLDAGTARLEIALEGRALGSDLVRALERLHALDEGTLWSSRSGLGGRLRRWRHGRRVYSADSLRQGPNAKVVFT